MKDVGQRSAEIAGLKHAIPYVRLFKGKTFVVKLGGESVADGATLAALLEQVEILGQLGIRVVLVHGGGPQTTALASRLGLATRMVDGRRVTGRVGGTLDLDMGWGKTRTLEIEPVSDTGFHLGTALYFGFKGHRHGMWLGPDHLDGEKYEDVSEYYTAREVHQLRDCVIQITEGDAVGYGIFETIVIGEHPRYGLDRELSFL